jgi:hypothetical protein
MKQAVYRYKMTEDISFKELERTLMMAVVAAEALHGRSAVRLGVSFCLDEKERWCIVDATTDVGLDLARIFTGFLAEEFGDEAFKVTGTGMPKSAAAEHVEAA